MNYNPTTYAHQHFLQHTVALLGTVVMPKGLHMPKRLLVRRKLTPTSLASEVMCQGKMN